MGTKYLESFQKMCETDAQNHAATYCSVTVVHGLNPLLTPCFMWKTEFMDDEMAGKKLNELHLRREMSIMATFHYISASCL